MKNIDYEMEDSANEYLNYFNDENVDRLSSSDRINNCTQLYANGETVVLQRQADLGIKILYDLKPYNDINPTMTPEQKRHAANREGKVKSVKEGSVVVGKSSRDLLVNERVILNDKVVYKSKMRCDCTVNLIKSDVDEYNKVACINCGYYGDLNSFKDGCDYCGAKYEVKDFEPKVSGFSMVENLMHRSTEIQRKLFFTYIFLFISVFVIDVFVTLFVVSNDRFLGFSVYDRMFNSTFILLIRMFIAMFILGIINAIYLKSKAYKFNNIKAVKDVMEDFSEIEFAQDVLFRLKTIIMARDYSSVEGFVDCDIREFYENHKDVFDIVLSSIKFINVQKVNNDNGINIGCSVRLKMLKLVNGKVKEQYETLDLQVAKALDYKMPSYASVRMYRCDKCGNAIDIFNNDTCEYCKSKLDKHKLGWVIEQLIYTKNINEYKMIPMVADLVMAIFILSGIF